MGRMKTELKNELHNNTLLSKLVLHCITYCPDQQVKDELIADYKADGSNKTEKIYGILNFNIECFFYLRSIIFFSLFLDLNKNPFFCFGLIGSDSTSGHIFLSRSLNNE